MAVATSCGATSPILRGAAPRPRPSLQLVVVAGLLRNMAVPWSGDDRGGGAHPRAGVTTPASARAAATKRETARGAIGCRYYLDTCTFVGFWQWPSRVSEPPVERQEVAGGANKLHLRPHPLSTWTIRDGRSLFSSASANRTEPAPARSRHRGAELVGLVLGIHLAAASDENGAQPRTASRRATEASRGWRRPVRGKRAP